MDNLDSTLIKLSEELILMLRTSFKKTEALFNLLEKQSTIKIVYLFTEQ